MRLSGIWYVYATRLEARGVLVQECFAVLGIAVGVAVLFASQTSSTSLARSVAQLNSQLVGGAQVQLDARGPEGVDERLLSEVRRVPGVQVALPVIERQVNLIGRGGAERSVDLVGVEPRSVRAAGPLLRRFSSQQLASMRAIALPSPLAGELGTGPLESIRVQVGARYVSTLVGATLDERYVGALVHSPVAVTSIGYGQSIDGARGSLSRIYIRFDPRRAREVRAALGRLAGAWSVNLRSSQADPQLFRVAVAPESKSEALFSSISALVGFMFALNAMLITVPSRRRLIADIRPHGATRGMTVQILLFDAFVLGGLACVLGLVLGDVLSMAVFHTTPGYLSYAFPIGSPRAVTWGSVVLAVGAGMAAAVVGVLWPLRDVFAAPLQSSPRARKRRGAWTLALPAAGLVCLAVTTVTLVADTKQAVVGNVALVLGLVLLLPRLFDTAVAVFERVSDRFNGISSALAVTELQAPQTRVRSLAIAVTAAIAVFAVAEFQGTQSNLKQGLESSIRGMDSSADIWVTPHGNYSLQATVPFTPVNTSTLAGLPGVRSVGVYRGSFLNWSDRRLWVIAPPSTVEHPIPASELVSGGLRLASARVRAGGWAVLSQELASEHHLHVGSTFVLPAPRPQIMRVAAVVTNLGWAPGAIILNSRDYARAWNSDEPSAYEIKTTPAASVAHVRNLAQQALGSRSGLTVETASEREQRHFATAAQGLSRLTQIRLIVLIASTLAIIGAMAAMVWQRRDRIAAMKCHGYYEGVLWRALFCESTILLGVGSVIGGVFGLYAQLLGSHFLSIVTGFPIVFGIEGIAAVSSFAFVTVIAVAALSVQGYFVVRVPPRTISPAY
jgi:putative ABC transport system permease protein